MRTYRHFSTVSSQVYFCAAPIRLDSYNRCQFGCTYCFSRQRSVETSISGPAKANPEAFRSRLSRVSEGRVNSAFDEFLAARVPVQFGGVQDPFSGIELKERVSLRMLKILAEFNYPTIISTKSSLVAESPYLEILEQMNVMVRLSAAGVAESARTKIEIGCPDIPSLLTSISRLSEKRIAVSLRIQPVIPGDEAAAFTLARRAAGAGARHISFEYLKVPTEQKELTLRRLSSACARDLWEVMRNLGVKRVGRDYTLTTDAKLPFVRNAKSLCRSMGVNFGAGDTEFIHLSDGSGCCNGSGLYLSGATQFSANLVGVLQNRSVGEEIFFSDILKRWNPKLNVHQYLTTNSRGRKLDGEMSSWHSLLAHRWNGYNGPYSPTFFYGVKWTGAYDDSGYKIYQIADAF